MSIIRLPNRLIEATLGVVLLALPAVIQANQPSNEPSNQQANQTELAAGLIETSGVGPHLANVSAVVFDEALPNYSQCFIDSGDVMSSEDEQQLKTALNQHLGPNVTVQRAIVHLSDAMELSELETVQAFFKSPAGARIIAAETASKDFDENTFEKQLEEYFQSGHWNEERSTLISMVYDNTRAARFVSTLNGEISVASALSGHCNQTPQGFKELQPQLDSQRSDSQFIEPIMRGDLIPVIATIFKDISNRDLEMYAEFAQSNIGKKFFDALLFSTANGISDGLPGLQKSLSQ